MSTWIEIHPDQVTPALTSLYTPDAPTILRAYAVLAGGNNGRIFTDDPFRPSWSLAWEADDGTLYRGGKLTREVLSGVISLLRQDGLVALSFREDDPGVALFPSDPNAGADCLEFERPIGSSDLSPHLGSLSPGFTLHRMDRTLLERSPKLDETRNRYSSLENFLARGLGVSILHGEEVVCEAYADMAINGMRELGVTTQAAYREQGLATRVCAYLIGLCEASGSATYWDCARLNLASAALAHRLGFRNERAYRLLAWFPTDFYGKNG